MKIVNEKLYENILVYHISYRTLIDAKPLRFRLDKVDGFIRVYDGTKHLLLFILGNMMLCTIG